MAGLKRSKDGGTTDRSGRYTTKIEENGYEPVFEFIKDGYRHIALRLPRREGEIEVLLYPCRGLQEVLPPPLSFSGPRWEPPPVWQPQPALVIGLGGTGRHVLTHLKKNMLDAGSGQMPDAVRLVLLDTSDYELLNDQKVPVSFAGVSLAPQDVVELGEDLRPIMEALRQDPNAEPEINWFPAADYKATLAYDELNLSHGTRQRRPPSRAALMRDIKKGTLEQGTNIVLVLDHSSSMNDPFTGDTEPITKLEAAQRAAILFIDQLDFSVDQVAVVQFDESAQIMCPLDQDRKSIKSAIQKIGSGGTTAIHIGLQEAQKILEPCLSDDSRKLIVLLSDGQSSAPETIAIAQALRQSNVQLVSVGIGDANEELLKTIASPLNGKPQYHYAGNKQDLARIYINLGRGMGDGSKLWRLLHGAARNAVDEDGQLRIILVGSLAGGFGSAVLADVAYLARRAGQSKAVGAKSISVEAYLATYGVFSGVSSRQEINAVNTFASLREIERFQLAQGYPFRMIYRADAESDPVLAGMIDWRLLDEIYLFDNIPAIQPSSTLQKDLISPSSTVFPIMADAVTLRLDKAVRTVGVGDSRNTIGREISEVQQAQGRAVVGSLGMNVYRLPMRDLFDILCARWVCELLYFMLVGEAGGDLRVDASLDQEESINEIATHVALFLLGGAGFENPTCPPLSQQYIGPLAYIGNSEDLEKRVKAATINLDQEIPQFKAYLSSAITTMLNGLKASHVVNARSGKFGYVLLFLDTLEHDLKQAIENLKNPEFPLEVVVEGYCKQVENIRNALWQQFSLLSKSFNKQENPVPGIYEKMLALELECRKRIDEMDQVLSRRYIHESSLLDTWYKSYFTDNQSRQDALSRLFWTIDQNGQVVLALRTWGEFSLGFSPFTFQYFINELLRLAGFIGRKLLENETLATVLSENVLSSDQLLETSTNLRDGSKPLLDYRNEIANNAKWGMLLGVNSTVHQKDSLTQSLRQGLPSDLMLRSVDITDPFTLLVAQAVDVVPLSALVSMKYAEDTYKEHHSLLPGQHHHSFAEQTAVYQAEKLALSFEQRLPAELNQTSRILRPVIVSGLDNENAARVYSLALAAGWVRNIGRTVKIIVPNQIQQPVAELPCNPILSLSPLIIGFLVFSATASKQQIDTLRSAMDTADQATLTAWYKWVSSDWEFEDLPEQLISSGPDGKDMASVVAIMVRDELRARKGN